MLPSNTKLVVALDTGTTYSGYAYCFTNKPEDILVGSFKGRPSNSKTPTSLLLNKAGKFVCYGQEAEDKFAELCEAGDDSNRLFRNFKMTLYHNVALSKSTKVQDISGQHSACVFDLLVVALRYLKNHVMRAINRFSDTFNEDDAFFVLLAPALFDDRAKWLMREAAIKVGMKPEGFTLALESETSSLWCLHENVGGLKHKPSRYITVDIGGGTADITAHESNTDGSVVSLHAPCGGDWGSINVDNCFKSYLSLLFGTQPVEDLVKQNAKDWYKLLKGFENAKLGAENSKTAEIAVPVPPSLLSSAVENKGLRGGYELAELIKSPNFGGHFKLLGERLEVDQEATEGMYAYTVNSVAGTLEQLLQQGVLCKKPVSHVVIIGGLADSNIVRQLFENNLKRHSLVFQQKSALFSLKGAVLYGCNMSLIKSRVMSLTYGLMTTVPYDEIKHAGADVTTINGVKMCTENFHVLVKAGTAVKPGHEVKVFDKPLRADDKEQHFEIYSCGAADDIPTLTSHCSMQKEASFSVPLPHGCLVEDKIFERCVIFGHPDISFRISFQKGKKDVYTRYMVYP